jgi:hypothetical protein
MLSKEVFNFLLNSLISLDFFVHYEFAVCKKVLIHDLSTLYNVWVENAESYAELKDANLVFEKILFK